MKWNSTVEKHSFLSRKRIYLLDSYCFVEAFAFKQLSLNIILHCWLLIHLLTVDYFFSPYSSMLEIGRGVTALVHTTELPWISVIFPGKETKQLFFWNSFVTCLALYSARWSCTWYESQSDGSFVGLKGLSRFDLHHTLKWSSAVILQVVLWGHVVWNLNWTYPESGWVVWKKN